MAVKGTVSIVFVMLYLARKIARSFIYFSQFCLHIHLHTLSITLDHVAVETNRRDEKKKTGYP